MPETRGQRAKRLKKDTSTATTSSTTTARPQRRRRVSHKPATTKVTTDRPPTRKKKLSGRSKRSPSARTTPSRRPPDAAAGSPSTATTSSTTPRTSSPRKRRPRKPHHDDGKPDEDSPVIDITDGDDDGKSGDKTDDPDVGASDGESEGDSDGKADGDVLETDQYNRYVRWRLAVFKPGAPNQLTANQYMDLADLLQVQGRRRLHYVDNRNDGVSFKKKLNLLATLWRAAVQREKVSGSPDDLDQAAWDKLMEDLTFPFEKDITQNGVKVKDGSGAIFTHWRLHDKPSDYDEVVGNWSIDDSTPIPEKTALELQTAADATLPGMSAGELAMGMDTDGLADLTAMSGGPTKAPRRSPKKAPPRSAMTIDIDGSDDDEPATHKAPGPPPYFNPRAQLDAIDARFTDDQLARTSKRQRVESVNRDDLRNTLDVLLYEVGLRLDAAAKNNNSLMFPDNLSEANRITIVQHRQITMQRAMSEVVYWAFKPTDFYTQFSQLLGSDPKSEWFKATITSMSRKALADHQSRNVIQGNLRLKRYPSQLKGRKIPEEAWKYIVARRPKIKKRTLEEMDFGVSMETASMIAGSQPMAAAPKLQRIDGTRSPSQTPWSMMSPQMAESSTTTNSIDQLVAGQQMLVQQMADLRSQSRGRVTQVMFGKQRAYGINRQVVDMVQKKACLRRLKDVMDNSTTESHGDLIKLFISGATNRERAHVLEGKCNYLLSIHSFIHPPFPSIVRTTFTT